VEHASPSFGVLDVQRGKSDWVSNYRIVIRQAPDPETNTVTLPLSGYEPDAALAEQQRIQQVIHEAQLVNAPQAAVSDGAAGEPVVVVPADVTSVDLVEADDTD
jgi:hypothetical protein